MRNIIKMPYFNKFCTFKKYSRISFLSVIELSKSQFQNFVTLKMTSVKFFRIFLENFLYSPLKNDTRLYIYIACIEIKHVIR